MGLSTGNEGPLTKKEKQKNKKQQKNVKGQGSNIEGNLRTGRNTQQYSYMPASAKDAIFKSVDNPKTPKPKTNAMYGDGQVKDVSTKLKKKKKAQLALKKATKKMNMGGVMKARGGTFKGTY
tara:strand:+ start:937 stop:1302 length:366 start_codon:yes stop_codon:yes gene_type:complete